MIALISDNLEEIRALCRKHRIARLDLFGSAAKGTFDPATSDLDFLVDLGAYDSSVANRFLDLADDLEKLLGRDVDLVTTRSLKNPYFIASVDAYRENVYDARDRQAAA
ncbi:MAG TPA: nucleotidyltransferase domain-containing protein [Thermomicrobiales bacterium]|nr:nucleotidyltransferase domain-containing protein [Thermomicrobiales bacterium]